MRLLYIGLVVFAFACKSKKDAPAPAPQPATPPAGSAAPATGSGSAAPATPPADAYQTHMEAGEKLEDQKKWSDALTEFEAALAAKPDDARALTEVSANAYFAGKLDRAKEAGIAGAVAAKDDKMRGAALFNLGLAVEKDQPYAAAQLYTAALALRPAGAIRARLGKLMKDKASQKATPDGDALLAKVNVKPGAAEPPSSTPANNEDQALIEALQNAGVEWQSGAGKSVLLAENVECQENHQVKPTTYTCTSPAAKGKVAKALVDALNGKKLAPKEHGDMVTFRAASVRCRSFNEGDSAAPDECTIEP